MAERFATDPRVVADQAGMVATAWSPADAPASWRLTAAQFEALRDDPELQAIAATIPPDRLPPLLFAAAATSLVLELDPQPLREWFPSVGRPQTVLGDQFGEQYRAFCLDQRERLLELCAAHRYQMNEVGRCADLLPALPTGADGREIALIDIGTGAGLALHLDRYRYVFRGGAAGPATVGDPDSSVVLETQVRGAQPLPAVAGVPRIADRVGIDVEPLNLGDPAVLAWLAACVPQEIGAVTRFHRAVDVAVANPARTVRGEALAALPDVLATIPDELLVCVVDSYVHVFFGDDELDRLPQADRPRRVRARPGLGLARSVDPDGGRGHPQRRRHGGAVGPDRPQPARRGVRRPRPTLLSWRGADRRTARHRPSGRGLARVAGAGRWLI